MAMRIITDARVEPLTESKYIRPIRFFFKLDGVDRDWDILQSHDAVVIILYHKDRRALLFVKQFRPSVFLNRVPADKTNGYTAIDWSKYPVSLGFTYEFCAGIVDKDKSIIEIAQDEILEECGYKVPLEKIERITSFRSGVGATGAMATMFYAEIDDTMKVSEGGGNPEEHEIIELEYIPIDVCKQRMLYDETIQRPSSVLFGIMWFYENKCPPLI